MAKTVVGLLDDTGEAQKVVEELLQNGFNRKDIGLLSSDLLVEAGSAIRGASAGIAIGGVAGMLLAAAAIAIPGIGPALVAGPALTLLAGTTIGALAGGLIGGLKSRGVPEDEAHFYAEGLRRGGTLVTANAESDELAARAVEIMKRHGAVDLQERAAEWRRQGWSGRYEERVGSPGPDQAKRDVPVGHVVDSPAAREARSALGADRPIEGSRSGANRAPQQAPVVLQDKPEALTEKQRASERGLPLSAVCVYSFVIEMPSDEAEEAGAPPTLITDAGAAANQPVYSGPERRTRRAPFAGTDRRRAA